MDRHFPAMLKEQSVHYCHPGIALTTETVLQNINRRNSAGHG